MTATASATDPQAPLREFRGSRDFFIGIDSDGCAFDTMEVKHKECFIPQIVRSYGLAAISKFAREAAEFVNLYSTSRGVNRFPALTATMDLLQDRPEVRRRGFEVPPLRGLRAWIARETKLANPTLEAEADRTGDPDLRRALEWSEAVNATIREVVRDVPPFPSVRESLAAMRGRADVLVVSATPGEALRREWHEHGLAGDVALIAGQEAGSKAEQLRLTSSGRYAPGRVLIVGDAPGDRKAAEAVGALFYPIEPGLEDESWARFLGEALPRFFAGTYAGAYMDERLARFEALLPDTPPWSR
ncbi:MAG TPA: HAD family hydrolase [Isosphaeraceae bacterium]|jgi:phosphoglycolate phosphatase-like HAD superfamily hydrolase|nr:HAD family hydrolase [Isosphaeraceae bacterium]